MTTTESNYDADLEAATVLIRSFVDFGAHDGNMRNAACDALNNEWATGLTVEQWAARALVRMNHGS